MATIYTDVVAIMVNRLREAFADRGVEAEVGDTIPTGREPNDYPRPIVILVGDTPPEVRHGGYLRQPVRLIAYHHTRDDVHDLIVLAHALALDIRGGGVRAVTARNGTGPHVTADPDTGEPMGAATVQAVATPADI